MERRIDDVRPQTGLEWDAKSEAMDRAGELPVERRVAERRDAPAPPEVAVTSFTEQQISVAARVLSNLSADACNVDRDDNWKIYGGDFISDARMALSAALSASPAVPVAAGLPAIPEPTQAMFLAAERVGVSFQAQQKCWRAWSAAAPVLSAEQPGQPQDQSGSIRPLAEPASQQESTPFDFHAHLARQAAFSIKTFGPGARTVGVTDHIRKELDEITAKPDDLMEWIDVVILALDGAWRCGGSPDQIINAIVAKQTKNEGRNWPDWRTADPNKAIEHDRSAEATAAPVPRMGGNTKPESSPIAEPDTATQATDELNNGMHASIFVKVWGDAGGGDAGRIALANYAFDLGVKSAATQAAKPLTDTDLRALTNVIQNAYVGETGDRLDTGPADAIARAIESHLKGE